MSKFAIAAVAALSTLITASAAMADTAATTFQVQVEVTKGCKVASDATPVDFGSAAGFGTKPADKTAVAKITCTNNTDYAVSLTSGNGFKMMNNTASIGYTVTGGGKDLTVNTNNVTGKGDGTEQTVSLVFSIPTAQWNAANTPGVFMDSVTLTVAY
jgi:spore coat protein U-like protein